MSSSEYWRRREEEALKHRITDEKEYDRRIKEIYQDQLDAIQKEIESFYARYAARENITLAEAKKRITNTDITKYERKAKRYVENHTFTKRANEEMRLYNATMRINRLEMLKANIGLELIAGHDELENFMGEVLKGRTEDELKRQAGILGKTIKNNAQQANSIPNASFHNATFSDRIWMYQDEMKADLAKLLQSGMVQGKNPRVLARDLRKYIGDDKSGAVFKTERLMRTELARVQTEAQKQSFERNGFEEYEFLANSSCCPECQKLNGKHFKVKDMMPGKNAAPMHPGCRCSVAAYEDSEEYNAWLDYLDKGGTTKEWEAHGKAVWKKQKNGGKFVAKPGENGIIRSGAISGALNPNSVQAQKHAIQYYESVRHMTNDVNRISNNIGWKSEAIKKIKEYIFIEEHDLIEGHQRFDPSYDMARSWQRLIEGKNIKEQDLVLLKHEYLEMTLVNKGMTQDEAHILASKKHNFAKYLE
jgi:SPP1 gp7 family putative phage head morphogenesis protein